MFGPFLFSRPSARSARHASENLNFREAVVRYQGLCHENRKKLRPTPSAGANARAVNTSTRPALSSSTAPVDDGLRNDSEGGRRGTALECGGGAGSAVGSCASWSSSAEADVAAAAAVAARDIVNRFVKEGAPEQVT